MGGWAGSLITQPKVATFIFSGFPPFSAIFTKKKEKAKEMQRKKLEKRERVGKRKLRKRKKPFFPFPFWSCQSLALIRKRAVYRSSR